MEPRLKASREKIDFLFIKAYHFLQGHKLNEDNLEQIIIKFNLTPIEVLRLTRKIQKLQQRYSINTKILARAIIKCRYKTYKYREAVFNEDSFLALF